MIKLQWTKSFKKNYQILPEDIKERIKKQLRVFVENPRHPSLRVKKMQDPRNIYEGRITYSYRFTFQVEGEIYILRKIGSHDILKNP
ncbi:MAG: type II toxin-antitoxin system RelE/ParE family toxin [bacterium]